MNDGYHRILSRRQLIETGKKGMSRRKMLTESGRGSDQKDTNKPFPELYHKILFPLKALQPKTEPIPYHREN